MGVWFLRKENVRNAQGTIDNGASRQMNGRVQKYCTEISAGGFVKRVYSNIKPSGGQNVQWIYEESSDGQNQYCTNDYIVLSTGEVKTKTEKDVEGRLANPRQISIACERFKWKVRANAEDARLFITLTYSENMTDTRRLYEDFRRFWQVFKKRYKVAGYLVAFEPQERGAWHAHLITIGGASYIPNEDVEKLWKHGFTKTMKCGNVADLGGYLTAYLTKIDGKKESRLNKYPARFRFLRWSKNLKEPTIKKFKAYEKMEIPNYTKYYSKTIEKQIEGIDKPVLITIEEFCENSKYQRWQKHRTKSWGRK